jgi:hypothetical protein
VKRSFLKITQSLFAWEDVHLDRTVRLIFEDLRRMIRDFMRIRHQGPCCLTILYIWYACRQLATSSIALVDGSSTFRLLIAKQHAIRRMDQTYSPSYLATAFLARHRHPPIILINSHVILRPAQLNDMSHSILTIDQVQHLGSIHRLPV